MNEWMIDSHQTRLSVPECVCHRWSVMTYEVPAKQTPAIVKEEDLSDSPLQVSNNVSQYCCIYCNLL